MNGSRSRMACGLERAKETMYLVESGPPMKWTLLWGRGCTWACPDLLAYLVSHCPQPSPSTSSSGLTPRVPQTTVYRYFYAYLFLLSRFSVLHFLVVGSVLSINLTHVDFQAHVKIASRIVSYVVRCSQGLSSDAVSSYQYRKKVAHTRLPSVGLRS